MNDSAGISHKGAMNMMAKQAVPSYVYMPNFAGTDSRPAGRRQGRNELCNCKSGKKYKNCCQITQVGIDSRNIVSGDIVKVPGFENSLKVQTLALDNTN